MFAFPALKSISFSYNRKKVLSVLKLLLKIFSEHFATASFIICCCSAIVIMSWCNSFQEFGIACFLFKVVLIINRVLLQFKYGSLCNLTDNLLEHCLWSLSKLLRCWPFLTQQPLLKVTCLINFLFFSRNLLSI